MARKYDHNRAPHRDLHSGDRGEDAKRLQHAVNLRLKYHGHSERLHLDGEVGQNTLHLFGDAAFLIGLDHRRPTKGNQRLMRWPWLRPRRMRKLEKARRPKPNTGLARARHIYNCCKAISDAGHPYLWGGGHSQPLRNYRVNSDFDCSGSVSYALFLAGEYHDAWARVSTGFESWGQPGYGRFITLHANGEHVWMQFHIAGLAWRFDTSPKGSGGYGPRLRWGSRNTSGFVARHPNGL